MTRMCIKHLVLIMDVWFLMEKACGGADEWRVTYNDREVSMPWCLLPRNLDRNQLERRLRDVGQELSTLKRENSKLKALVEKTVSTNGVQIHGHHKYFNFTEGRSGFNPEIVQLLVDQIKNYEDF